ncbi:MAG: anhydro-N-acetylmuramic acid kinase, partial [Hyphomicrobiaceae bacterium]
MHGKAGMSKRMRAIGLMSGTSLDGIDIAMIETDGECSIKRLASAGVDYPEDFRTRLRQALSDAAGLAVRTDRPGCLAEVEEELTRRHAEAVLRFIGDKALQPFAIDVIGFHGQTVWHDPANGITVQIGDGERLARATGIDVVYELRAADVDAGGQGAPLVPVYHQALATRLPERPVAFLNIGGVANLTYVGPNGMLIAFDTGPGNALIDDFVRERTGRSHDEDGALARAGKADEDALLALLSHPYFAATPPKSLDRNAFSRAPVARLSTEDGAATLTAFTAEAVRRGLSVLPDFPRAWIVTGGGRRNRALMTELAARLDAMVAPAEALGLNGDAMEAEAWAYLA